MICIQVLKLIQYLRKTLDYSTRKTTIQTHTEKWTLYNMLDGTDATENSFENNAKHRDHLINTNPYNAILI